VATARATRRCEQLCLSEFSSSCVQQRVVKSPHHRNVSTTTDVRD
jgi:hypothetical protein